ncbi:hypothetical protein HanIR_Chr06g0258461 [Helianthus annuus]|nr:hypothetical protein HanIR_Chr06g0258461 [Helianthus annuus]
MKKYSLLSRTLLLHKHRPRYGNSLRNQPRKDLVQPKKQIKQQNNTRRDLF